jgi:hypothetical protein
MSELQPRPRRPDTRSPVGEAMVWVSRIMAIGLSMFLPGLAGGWLDARLGVGFLGPAGFILGFAGGLWQLAAIAKRRSSS